jgi:D-amino peptidase
MTLDGLDASFDCVFMIGIHARAGTDTGVLDHTWVPKCVQSVRVNDVTIGELGLNALAAGHFGVPIALVTGDAQVVQEAHELLGDVEGVAVKVGLSRYAARGPHPSKAREAIRKGAAKALREIERFKPFQLSSPLKLEIDYSNTAFAAAASWIPTAVREGPQTVSFSVPDFVVGFRTFSVAAVYPWKAADDQMF